MKKNPLHTTFLASFALVFGVACIVLANMVDAASADQHRAEARSGIVEISTALTQTKIFAATDATTGMALTLTADEVKEAQMADRNVDLVVVLDRSGSMAGSKIRDARDSVAELLRALHPGDRFALVSYANDVNVHGQLTQVTNQTRPGLIAGAMSIESGGGTNLGGGLAAGLELLAQGRRYDTASGRMSENLAKVILISDGHANQGVVDPNALGHMAARGYRSDASVTTVGVGVDYNEHLMGTIADHGGGNYYFLENPAMFASLFLEELSLTRSVAARNLEILIPLPAGVTVLDAAGYPFEMRGNTAVLHPGHLRSGQTRTIFLTLGVDGQPGRKYVLENISASYQRGENTHTATIGQPLIMETVADEALAVSSIDPELWTHQTVQEDYNRLREEISRDIASGDRDGAMAKIDKYENEKRALNSTVQSAAVADNLDNGITSLKETVEESLNPAAPMAVRKQASKMMQSESYDTRRAKTKN